MKNIRKKNNKNDNAMTTKNMIHKKIASETERERQRGWERESGKERVGKREWKREKMKKNANVEWYRYENEELVYTTNAKLKME